MKATRRGRPWSSSRPLIAGTAILGVLALSACGGSDEAAGGDKNAEYKIGLLAALTGNYSAVGEDEANGAKAYVEHINAKGGVNGHKINLVVADTTSNESVAVNQYRKLAGDNVLAILGPGSSGEAIAIKPAANSMGIPTMGMVATAKFVTPIADSKWTFKNIQGSAILLRSQMRDVKADGAKTVGMISINSSYGKEYADAFAQEAKDAGLEPIASELYDPAATDMTAQMTALKAKNPDAIIVAGNVPGNAIIVRNAKKVGYQGKISQATGAAAQSFIKAAGPDAEGVIVQGFKEMVPDELAAGDAQKPAVDEFVAAYTKAYNKPPTSYAGFGWEGMALLVKALEKVKPGDVKATREALRVSIETNISAYAGIHGNYSYTAQDHAGQGLDGLAVLEVKGGKFTLKRAVTG